MFKPKSIPRPWDPRPPGMRPMQERHSVAFYHTARWTRESRAFRRANPLCKECEKEDIVEAAEVVDHIVPAEICGDPWDRSNWQGLCRTHNNKKAARDKILINQYKKQNKMKNAQIKKRIKELQNNPDYEFRFLMAGVYIGKPIIRCGICEKMVKSTVQTAYHKIDAGKSIGICQDCYQIMVEK